jgi:hypothetical protein
MRKPLHILTCGCKADAITVQANSCVREVCHQHAEHTGAGMRTLSECAWGQYAQWISMHIGTRTGSAYVHCSRC